MRNVLIKMKYDGSNYHGWQIQSNAVTVQETFQKQSLKKDIHTEMKSVFPQQKIQRANIPEHLK